MVVFEAEPRALVLPEVAFFPDVDAFLAGAEAFLAGAVAFLAGAEAFFVDADVLFAEAVPVFVEPADLDLDDEDFFAPVADLPFDDDDFVAPAADLVLDDDDFFAPAADFAFEDEDFVAPAADFAFDDEGLVFDDTFLVAVAALFADAGEAFFEDAAFRDPREAEAVWRLTSLLNRFPSSSDNSIASLLRSNHSKNSSHSISSRVSSPLKPGKSMRSTPGSLREPVRFTRAGCPPRASTHCRISSWSVVACAVAMSGRSVHNHCQSDAARPPQATRRCTVMR